VAYHPERALGYTTWCVQLNAVDDLSMFHPAETGQIVFADKDTIVKQFYSQFHSKPVLVGFQLQIRWHCVQLCYVQ
jgi:hypothetical protein